MNKEQITASRSDGTSASDDIGIFGLLAVLARQKRLVVGLPVVAAVLSAVLSLVLPVTFKASAQLLPPQQASSATAMLLSQLGGMAGGAVGAAALKTPNEMYIGMLRSRTVADKLVAKFDLKKVYGTDSDELARRTLEANTEIASGKDGLIVIFVEDRNQQLVAPLTNGYIAELLALTRVLAVTEASQRRLFFGTQLELAKNNLAKAELSLKGSLDANGVVSVDGQSQAIVETVARLRATASVKEVELSSMRAFVTTANTDYQRVQHELSSVRAELSKLENGRPRDAGAGNAVQPGLDNIQRLRDVKYYQMLYELLAKQYEVARIDEAKDTAVVQVLDAAVTPERKFRPRRMLMVLACTFIALFAAVALALLRDALRSEKNAREWQQLKQDLRRL
ncbi:Wzz/FepE/Etk N-terminal domain-containing protein [Massilia sp. TSP1-1-2]|uniref:Wzz/FepE/Etk N-terminal domain-containing protein n=1 Tax=Massilia sp. TSP1-1-2 TaxID=2804649 RepID=UPI003CEF9F06